ncbi:MAG: site-2 protease family protein, partial [Bacteroidota bacterium]
VKISGMIDESMDKEQLNQPAQPYEFRSKPAWQRLIIMLGGVIVNFVLALVLFAMILFVWGEERLPVKNLTYGLSVDSLAQSAGLKNGDAISAVNNKPVQYLDEIRKSVFLNETTTLTVQRNGKDTMVTLPKGFLSNITKNQQQLFLYPRIPIIISSGKNAKIVSGNLQAGDKVVGVNNTRFSYFDEYVETKKKLTNQNITLQLLRNGTDTVQTIVKTDEYARTAIDIKSYDSLLTTEKKKYSFFQSIPAGINYGVDRLGDYITGIGLLFTSKEHKVSDNLGSVISIGKTFGGVWDWYRFWTMTALFSIILAFMNILPIPALDGGHALFTIYEMITGRKPSDKFMEYAQMVGMVLLLGLMLYAFGLDIWRLFK